MCKYNQYLFYNVFTLYGLAACKYDFSVFFVCLQ